VVCDKIEYGSLILRLLEFKFCISELDNREGDVENTKCGVEFWGELFTDGDG